MAKQPEMNLVDLLINMVRRKSALNTFSNTNGQTDTNVKNVAAQSIILSRLAVAMSAKSAIIKPRLQPTQSCSVVIRR